MKLLNYICVALFSASLLVGCAPEESAPDPGNNTTTSDSTPTIDEVTIEETEPTSEPAPVEEAEPADDAAAPADDAVNSEGEANSEGDDAATDAVELGNPAGDAPTE